MAGAGQQGDVSISRRPGEKARVRWHALLARPADIDGALCHDDSPEMLTGRRRRRQNGAAGKNEKRFSREKVPPHPTPLPFPLQATGSVNGQRNISIPLLDPIPR